MPSRGLVPVDDEPDDDEPTLAELIIRVKDDPGKKFRVGVWEKKGTAEKNVNRLRKRFRESEPDIVISSGRLKRVDGWGVFARYLPPGLVRDDT